ncbi:acyl-CoA/acyl-ACP dehydrogenase [Lachnospiraceae bacterium ZAX-1]
MLDFLLNEEQKKIQEEARDFVKSIPKQYVLDMDADKIKFPKEFLKEAAHRGLLGCRYPKEWGGRDLDWVASQAVLEEIGVLGYIFACTFGVGAELVCDAIIRHGTDAQKEKYVKPLLRGDLFAAECLTEPRGGSDFFGATTIAEDKGEYFLLNGQKRFIVGGEGADYFLVYARTNLDPAADPHEAISALLVDKTDQVEVSYLYGLMGCKGGGAARIVFKNAKVPKENIVGKLNGGEAVFNTMMIPERLGTACMTIGTGRAALDVATKYTMQRKQFGKVIRKFQGVSFQVADAIRLLDTSRAICYTTCVMVDKWDKKDPVANVTLDQIRRQVSEAKKHTTESCQQAARLSMQVMGGIGYTNVYPVERYVRDLSLASIWTGTSEVMNLIVSSDWYAEYRAEQKDRQVRNYELDAPESEAADEKIFE